MNNPEDSKPEEESENEDKPFVDEETSYSFLFFATSGALLFVTLWSFWDDEYGRRGYKQYQTDYFKAQYSRAEDNWKEIDKNIASKEKELKNSLSQVDSQLDDLDEYQLLLDEVLEAEIKLAEVEEEKKFAGSKLDEAYYYYKKAMHEGENFDVQKAKVHEIEKVVESWNPRIDDKARILKVAEDKLLLKKAKREELDKELKNLVRDRSDAERTMDFYKPFPFIYRASAVEQTVIPGYGLNNFSEITYKVDRCQSCHISYQDTYYDKHAHPLKTHPNLDILIKKHPPGRTGCECHRPRARSHWDIRTLRTHRAAPVPPPAGWASAP